MVIDAHQHFWIYNLDKHAWIDDSMAAIRSDFLPTDLKVVLEENGIDGTVAVQADQTIEETNFLIDLSRKNSFIKGVVAWVDFRSDSLHEQLSTYHDLPIVKGFRHVVQAEEDHNFLLRDNFSNGIAQLKNFDFTYDLLVFPHQLGASLEFVKKFPDQKFVIDHLAKPYIKDQYYDGWAVLIKEIGKMENVYCKLSGMVTEADYHTWHPEQIRPYMDHVLESFGPERLMFGSDWPVCLVAGNYQKVKKLVTNHISSLSSSEQEGIMGNNAVKFYNLNE